MKKFEREIEKHYSHVREDDEMMKNKWRHNDWEVFNESEMHGYLFEWLILA